jgi:hypothetical protein
MTAKLLPKFAFHFVKAQIPIKKKILILNNMNSVKQFNEEFKILFKFFKELPSQGFKSKVHINELYKSMKTCMETEEKYIITMVGPYIWAAREEITNRDLAFFIKKRYEVEVMELSKKLKFNYQDAINTINFMKDASSNASKENLEKIFIHILTLIKYYAQYLQKGGLD